jgi:hypothetical protein
MSKGPGKYSTAAARWSGVGPYYAMFPAAFAHKVIETYTRPKDTVLDPFAGRGTAVFSAAINGRHGIGIEINPVGWVYSQAKLRPASEDHVAARFATISNMAHRFRRPAENAPRFFHCCYSRRVLQFLLAARACLDWRHKKIDWTAMSFLLVNLHGKRDGALSNQMRQTKSMSPDYAIRWWQQQHLNPPDINPEEFLLTRLKWRYAKGIPDTAQSKVYLGDSTKVLRYISRYLERDYEKAQLLITSPPYYGVTDYHYDQWLRLWMLGGPPVARRARGLHRGKFENKLQYRQLLADVFSNARPLLRDDATVYVRTDRRELTLATTIEVLRQTFPNHRLARRVSPHTRPTQTNLFGHTDPRMGEIDLILTPRP